MDVASVKVTFVALSDVSENSWALTTISKNRHKQIIDQRSKKKLKKR